MYRWTVDFESNWGGRGGGCTGIAQGIPRILKVFDKYNIKALFFISTEMAQFHKQLIETIMAKGHSIGSHGHFHINYGSRWRAAMDKDISEIVLKELFGVENSEYRAPWFSYYTDSVYSRKDNHVSVLKMSWIKTPLPDNPIFYIHPFDIVGGRKAPNLLCKLLYSRPNAVYNTFTELVRLYPS